MVQRSVTWTPLSGRFLEPLGNWGWQVVAKLTTLRNLKNCRVWNSGSLPPFPISLPKQLDALDALDASHALWTCGDGVGEIGQQKASDKSAT
jgi:hypothetical protein